MSDATPPPPPPPPSNPYQGNTNLSASDEKLWATLIHIGGIFFSFIPALIGYLILKDRGPFVRAHSATALNFQLTLLIWYIVGTILSIIIIGLFIIWIAAILSIIFSIIAAVAANKGQSYAYPITIRFVK